MSTHELIQDDILSWAESYAGTPFSAILCDPPYCLTSISRRFGAENAATAKVGKSGVYSRASAGFMGCKWDDDIAFRPETWAALGKHLYPGAFCMAFAGTRGYHRMACAIEDAGFILHPMMVWIFGSGFPKATRIDTQVDKAAGEHVEHGKAFNFKGGMNADGRAEEFMVNGRTAVHHAAKSDRARAWAEHRYGLQALKPALEPICVFQKPYSGRPVDCIVETGAGALNIGKGRLAASGEPQKQGVYNGSAVQNVATRTERAEYAATLGRWPANLLLSEEVCGALDRQSGARPSGGNIVAPPSKTALFGSCGRGEWEGYKDSGGASRFFFRSDFLAEEQEPYFYCGKSGRVERDAGLEGMPAHKIMGGDLGLTQRMENGAITHARTAEPVRNAHPTIKSLRLTRYLASLLLPPAEYAPRRLLIPFAGVASEMCGAYLAGWEQVVGIEQSAEYVEIGEARLRFWQGNVGLFESLTADEDEDESPPVQTGLEF